MYEHISGCLGMMQSLENITKKWPQNWIISAWLSRHRHKMISYTSILTMIICENALQEKHSAGHIGVANATSLSELHKPGCLLKQQVESMNPWLFHQPYDQLTIQWHIIMICHVLLHVHCFKYIISQVLHENSKPSQPNLIAISVLSLSSCSLE